MISRRGLLVAAALLASGQMAGAKDAVPRLTGEINHADFPQVAAFLRASLKKQVAFDVTLPADNDESDGHLTTFVLDGQFEIAYLAGKKSLKLYAETGFDLVDDKYYTFKGVFTVKSGGRNEDGVAVIALDDVTKKIDTFQDMPVTSLKKPK